MSRLPAMAMLSLLSVVLFFPGFCPRITVSGSHSTAAIYHEVNHQAVRHPLFAGLLAIANNRMFDLCSLLAMGIVYLRYYLHADAAACWLLAWP